MNVEEKLVKEFHFTFTSDVMPKTKFTVRADTYEKALKILAVGLRAILADIGKQTKKGQEKPTT
jgi:hypothetical protein